jgi:arginine exporter protein ArgO
LLGLAVWGAASAVLRHRSAATITDGGRFWTARRAYFGLLGVTMLNPATVVYFAALVLGNGAILSSSVLAAAVFVVAVFGASASWQLLLAGGGVVLGRWLTGPRGALVTAVASSVIIAALAVNVLLSA